MEWLKNNWVKILVGVFILIIVLGILKTLNSVLNCSGPLCKGLSQAFGAVAGVINSLTSGCTTQPDCSPLKDKDTCNNTTNCSWSSTSSTGVCVNTTGRAVGSGGLTSLDCGFFLGFLGLLGALIVGPILKWGFKRFGKKNANVEAEAQISGEDVGVVNEKAATEGREKATEAVENLEEPSDSQVKLTGYLTGVKVALKRLMNAVLGKTELTQEQKNQQIADSTEIAAQQEQSAEDEANKENVSQEQQNEADNAANDAVDGGGGGGGDGVVHLTSQINAYQALNRVPSQNAHKLLTKKVNYHLRKGNFIHPDHINFLNQFYQSNTGLEQLVAV